MSGKYIVKTVSKGPACTCSDPAEVVLNNLRRSRWPMQQRVSKPASERERFLRFVVTGGIAAGVNVGVCWLLSFVMSYEMAVALSYLAGMTTAFTLARTYVFDGEGGRATMQYSRFALVNAVAFAQVWLVSVGLARGLFPAIGYTFHADTVAHVIGVGSPIVTSYIGHKKISFR